MTTILVALLFFSVFIIIHELGHFLVARAVGIHVEEFSIGMGPRLIKLTGKETEYSIRALPIGGYVRFLGEDESSDDPRAFNNAKVWKRFLVITSGPVMNMMLAVILLSILLFSFGQYVSNQPVIESLISGYPAEQAGLQEGDRIIGIGEEDIRSLSDTEAVERIQEFIRENGSKPFTITIQRKDQVLSYDLMPIYDENNGRWQVGFYFKPNVRKFNFWETIGTSFVDVFRITGQMLIMLKEMIFSGQGLSDVMGPVGIVSEIGKAAQAGIQQLLQLGIIITINLSIMNLIPFPALDGGRLLLLIIEGIRGKPIDREKEGYFHLIGFVLLMILMIIVTYKDILRI